MTDASLDPPPIKLLAGAARDLLETTAVYLAVAAMSGVAYALCALAWNGGIFVRLWLAAVVPIAVFLVAKSTWLVGRSWLTRLKGPQRPA